MFYGGVGDIILIIDEVEQDFIFATRVPIFLEEIWNVSNNDKENEISEELVHHNIESKYSKICSVIQSHPPLYKGSKCIANIFSCPGLITT